MNNLKSLTPAQRALVQLAESILITGFVAGCVAILPLLTGANNIDWPHVGFVFLFALLISLAHGAIAYLKPGQPDLSVALESIIDALEARYEQKQQALEQATQPMQAVKSQNDATVAH